MRRALTVATVAAVVGLTTLGIDAGEKERRRRAQLKRAQEVAAASSPTPSGTPLARSVPVPGSATDDPCPFLWDTPLGRFWYPERNKHGLEITLREQIANLYETREVSVRPGDVVLDVGAYVGTFTRVALNKGAAEVWAIEPNTTSAACMKKTFADEIRAGTVHVLEVAAWGAKGRLRFEGDGILFHVAAEPTGPAADLQTGSVPADTIDSLAAANGITRVDFVKMDIEGSEREALKGAAGVIAQHGPRMAIALYHDAHRAARIVPDWAMIPHLILQARGTYHVRTNAKRMEGFFFDPTGR